MAKHFCSAMFAASLSIACFGAASAGTLSFDLGPSIEPFTLYGLGPISPGVGSFTVGQGASVYDSSTNTSTFTLSGSIAGGSPGYGSGAYSFVTTYLGEDTPAGGPNSPIAQSNPSDTNEFFYDFLDPSTTMTLDLFGTPTGDHVIPLVIAGSFVSGTGFSFEYASSNCNGVSVCGQNEVGLTPGASIFGPVTISVSVTTGVPEPSTWAMMAVGFASLTFAGWRGRRASLPAS